MNNPHHNPSPGVADTGTHTSAQASAETSTDTSGLALSPNPIAWPDNTRRAAFDRWLAAITPRHALRAETLASASADASFRRYFRIHSAQGASFIIMDAPPPQEDVRPFVQIAGLIRGAGLNAPVVHEADAGEGFLLLGDLGQTPYLQALGQADAAGADRLMRDAISALVQFQLRVPYDRLPLYDEPLLARELALFPDWCVEREFGVVWSESQRGQWQQVCRSLLDSALAQPTLAVHRDWMPRNLMVCGGSADADADANSGILANPGILDFQDAVRGPISYDIACLLRDAFISWDEEREIDWAARYWSQARRAALPVPADFGEFWRQVEWMGLQRHLKVLGIFCRLKHRDGKPAYSADLPRFFNYATKVALRYRPLQALLPLIEPLSGIKLSTGLTF